MIQTVIIPQYIREIQLSAARRIKYYSLGMIPKAKKYHDKTKYDFQTVPGQGTKQFLVNLQTGERVIANPKAQGTPNIMVINGQKIYNGAMKEHTRCKVMSDIKKSFEPYINAMQPITSFPIKIRLEIHDVIRETNSHNLWDADNRAAPYIKAFQDSLTGNKSKERICKNKVIIPDDNILYITQPPATKFIPVDHDDDRKLVFIIEEEDDNRILKHLGYIKELQKLKN